MFSKQRQLMYIHRDSRFALNKSDSIFKETQIQDLLLKNEKVLTTLPQPSSIENDKFEIKISIDTERILTTWSRSRSVFKSYLRLRPIFQIKSSHQTPPPPPKPNQYI